MSHTVRPDQTYRSNRPVPLGPARVRITAYTPGEPSANAVDPDTGASCVVLVDDLHATAPTGDARHDGYTLTPDDSTDRRHTDYLAHFDGCPDCPGHPDGECARAQELRRSAEAARTLHNALANARTHAEVRAALLEGANPTQP
ncbi:hypothetical protein ACPCSE_29330 [Streptomyces cellulosae]